MNKKYGFLVVVIIFITVIIGFYIFLKEQQRAQGIPIRAVPVNSALIIDIKNPQRLYVDIIKENNFLNKLTQFNEVSNFVSHLKILKSVAKNDIKLKQLLKQPLLISIHEIGNKEYYSLYVIKISGRFEANQIIKAIDKNWGKTNKIVTKRYNQTKIYEIKNDNSTTSFFYSYHNGLFLLSKSEILLQNAIRQSESNVNLLSDGKLSQMIKTSGNNAKANIYIQFEFFQKFLSKVISTSFLKKHSFKQIGDWLELDLNLHNKTLLFNGFSNADKDKNRFINVFRDQSPQKIDFLQFAPASSESFFGFGLSNYTIFKRNLRKYMTQIGEIDRYNINYRKIQQFFGKNADNDLKEIFKNEIAQVSLPDNSTLFYIKTNGFRNATELIDKWFKNYCRANGKRITDYKNNFVIDKESKFPIYRMPLDYLPTRIFGPWFKSSKAQYVTVYDSYIIFGDTYKALSKVIYNNVLHKTLIYDTEFTQFADYMSSKANYFGFMSLSGTGDILKTRMDSYAYKYYKKNQGNFRNFYAVAWQFTLENNLFYNNLLFRYQPANTLKALTEWETRLDTIIAFKPQMVINHYTKEKEIFVQDKKNNIYLINHSGRLLWKKHIEEAIMGEVFQIDYFKNGKLQYLFNTKSKIYMFDRNGNFVERYPISLPDKAVAPLSVFDYDKNKKYRLFIPLINKKVKVYDTEGKSISGFKFKSTDNNIIAPVQYVRDNNKDYIIITDKSRIYILNRKGERRVKLQKQFNPSANNIFEYQPGNKKARLGRLVRTDTDGNIYYIYFNGKVEKKHIIQCSPNHYFNTKDVTGDRINDFIFIDKNKMSVYSLTGKKIYSYKFSSTIKHSPAFYKFSSNKTYIGVTEVDNRKIYLFNNKGKILKGFPLLGKTRFSIGVLEPNSGRFNLVVGGDEYYLYNYKLN